MQTSADAAFFCERSENRYTTRACSNHPHKIYKRCEHGSNSAVTLSPKCGYGGNLSKLQTGNKKVPI